MLKKRLKKFLDVNKSYKFEQNALKFVTRGFSRSLITNMSTNKVQLTPGALHDPVSTSSTGKFGKFSPKSAEKFIRGVFEVADHEFVNE